VTSQIKTFTRHWINTSVGAFLLPLGFPKQAVAHIVEKDGQVWAFGEQPLDNTDDGALIYPYLQECLVLANGEQVVVQGVTTPDELRQCRQVQDDTHYLDWPKAGMYLCAKIGQKVVGALVLSRLPPHMSPRWRRQMETERGHQLEALWVRRIAIQESYQRMGIGSCLASIAIEVARNYWLPKPDIVELISINGNYNFLLNNGFSRADEPHKGPLNLREGTELHRRQVLRYYYWAELQ
jgi:GNAT superfamily N-acetyltransferase